MLWLPNNRMTVIKLCHLYLIIPHWMKEVLLLEPGDVPVFHENYDMAWTNICYLEAACITNLSFLLFFTLILLPPIPSDTTNIKLVWYWTMWRECVGGISNKYCIVNCYTNTVYTWLISTNIHWWTLMHINELKQSPFTRTEPRQSAIPDGSMWDAEAVGLLKIVS